MTLLPLYLLYHRFTTDFCPIIGCSPKAALLHKFQQPDCEFIKVTLLPIHQMYPLISYCWLLVLVFKRLPVILEYGWLMMGCGRWKYSCFPKYFTLYPTVQVTELLLYQRFPLMSGRWWAVTWRHYFCCPRHFHGCQIVDCGLSVATGDTVLTRDQVRKVNIRGGQNSDLIRGLRSIWSLLIRKVKGFW